MNNLNTLTLRDLEYVVAVAEQRHFGRAAQACHVSQPALSAQVRKVEEVLETRIFERSNRNVEVTVAGEAIVQQARLVLEAARGLGRIAQGNKAPLTGPYRLGVIATVGPYLLPHFLGALRSEFPQLELVIREGMTDGLVRELRAGALDGVIASPTFPEQGLERIPLFWEPFLLAAPKGHPLLARKPLRAADLKGAEMVLLEEGHCLADQSIEACAPNRRGGFRRFQATSLETLRHIVATGAGYTLIPMLAVTDDGRLKDLLRYREFDGEAPGREVALFFRASGARSEDTRKLAHFFEENRPDGVSRSGASGSPEARKARSASEGRRRPG